MSIGYGVTMLLSVYVFTEFNLISTDRTVFFIVLLITAPVGWFYFSQKLKNRLTVAYEIDNDTLRITEKGKLPQTINIQSITSITKIADAYRVIADNRKYYILDIVENDGELIRELKKYLVH